jgi:hypothetical protein
LNDTQGLKFDASRGNADYNKHGDNCAITATARKVPAKMTDRPCRKILGLVCVGLFAAAAAPAIADGCERAEFEAVVAKASETLRDLSVEKKPAYQAKLRGLMEKRGWTYDQFVKEAGPLVTDDKVSAFDQTSADLLAKINRMGEGSATDAAPGSGPACAALKDLRATMAALVATQTEKWTYLFAKLDAETAR